MLVKLWKQKSDKNGVWSDRLHCRKRLYEVSYGAYNGMPPHSMHLFPIAQLSLVWRVPGLNVKYVNCYIWSTLYCGKNPTYAASFRV